MCLHQAQVLCYKKIWIDDISRYILIHGQNFQLFVFVFDSQVSKGNVQVANLTAQDLLASNLELVCIP